MRQKMPLRTVRCGRFGLPIGGFSGGSNGGYYINARFEEIMAEAEHYTDEARLTELMIEAQNILTEQDPPVIYYGQLLWYTILRNNIQGFVGNPISLSAFNFYTMAPTSASPPSPLPPDGRGEGGLARRRLTGVRVCLHSRGTLGRWYDDTN